MSNLKIEVNENLIYWILFVSCNELNEPITIYGIIQYIIHRKKWHQLEGRKHWTFSRALWSSELWSRRCEKIGRWGYTAPNEKAAHPLSSKMSHLYQESCTAKVLRGTYHEGFSAFTKRAHITYQEWCAAHTKRVAQPLPKYVHHTYEKGCTAP